MLRTGCDLAFAQKRCRALPPAPILPLAALLALVVLPALERPARGAAFAGAARAAGALQPPPGAARSVQGKTGRKVYISADMEGISGISGDDQLAPGRPEPVLPTNSSGQSQARSPLKFPAPLAVTVNMQNTVGLE